MSHVDEAKARMADAVEAIRREFATVRTGKATPALLDTVRVNAYGSLMPLNQVATISTPDPTLIVVQPFDPSVIQEIEKAIMAADLGLNPANDGALIRVPVPPLNEERRREYAKLLHKMAEEGRVSLRHARHKANDALKTEMKEHEISEDEGHRLLDQVQKLTDEYGQKIDDLLEQKEKEVMAI
ncbi:MAG: ribosome recycling factor [Gemmatimonadetes bacterium]|nr:ribosome recycling factor [Gemmatimonadota bacterium]